MTKRHECLEGDHVINIFSFSKAYGLMGWRVGFLSYPPALQASFVKVSGATSERNGVERATPPLPTRLARHLCGMEWSGVEGRGGEWSGVRKAWRGASESVSVGEAERTLP